MEPMNVLSNAWKRVAQAYQHEGLPGQRDGFAAKFWWSERDIVLRVAAWCAEEIGWDWVHMEVTGFSGARAVDLCFANPGPWKSHAGKTSWPRFRDYPVDLAVEFKIVTVERGCHQYTPAAVADDVEKLRLLREQGLVRGVAVCVIDGREQPTEAISVAAPVQLFLCP
jgi:hypothetical protein